MPCDSRVAGPRLPPPGASDSFCVDMNLHPTLNPGIGAHFEVASSLSLAWKPTAPQMFLFIFLIVFNFYFSSFIEM